MSKPNLACVATLLVGLAVAQIACSEKDNHSFSPRWHSYTSNGRSVAYDFAVRRALRDLLVARHLGSGLGRSQVGALDNDVRSLATIVCGEYGPGLQHSAVVNGEPIDQAFLPDALDDAETAGCGVLYLYPGGFLVRVRGVGVDWD
jgi:hypothetical protein